MMKLHIKLMLVALALNSVTGCTLRETRMNSSISMMALNSIQPFVSKSLAEKLALLIIEDRYPPSFFSPDGSGVVVDGGDAWLVTFDNRLVSDGDNQEKAMVDLAMIPRKLTIVIRKNNAEVIDIR